MPICSEMSYPLGFVLAGANVSDFDQAKPLLKARLCPIALAVTNQGYDRTAKRGHV